MVESQVASVWEEKVSGTFRPLAIYRGEPLDTAAVKALANDAKAVVIPYLTEGGKAVTPGKSRVIWPYACKLAGK